jgi:5-methylcytosine-specific restriction endonuclease McrA
MRLRWRSPVSTANALVLNADFSPYKVISWERAVLMLLDEKADLVTEYVGKLVRSASASMPWPAVIRLRKYVHVSGRLRFNRQNVLARDAYTCGYCGVRPRLKTGRPNLEELTLDHVVPRAQSVNGRVQTRDGRQISVTCWGNVISSCGSCNARKADRTPEQAGMKLRKIPRTPTSLDVLRMSLTKVEIPTEWTEHLPQDSEWRGYWTSPLDED